MREAAGLTQSQVSIASGLSLHLVRHMEAVDSISNQTIGTIDRYVEALGATLELVACSRLGHRIVLVGPGWIDAAKRETKGA
jgi:transcriptional regulator with XRE-family HTH domain